MARGGKRTYTRDANGRFASTPGGALGAARKAARSRSGRTSTLGARTSLKKSRAKLAGKDPADQRLSTALSARAQKGAVTRGNKELKAAKVAARTQIGGGMKGGIVRSRSAKSQLTGAKPAAPVLRDSSRAKGSRTRLPRVGGVVTKPKALKPGAITSRIQNRNRNVIKEISRKINKAEQRFRQLSRVQREIDYKRSNPIGGKAFRSQVTRRLNQEQRKLDKSKGKVYSAIELNYRPKKDRAYNVLAQIERAAKALPQATVSRKNVIYQRNLFGGSTAYYGV